MGKEEDIGNKTPNNETILAAIAIIVHITFLLQGSMLKFI